MVCICLDSVVVGAIISGFFTIAAALISVCQIRKTYVREKEKQRLEEQRLTCSQLYSEFLSKSNYIILRYSQYAKGRTGNDSEDMKEWKSLQKEILPITYQAESIVRRCELYINGISKINIEKIISVMSDCLNRLNSCRDEEVESIVKDYKIEKEKLEERLLEAYDKLYEKIGKL